MNRLRNTGYQYCQAIFSVNTYRTKLLQPPPQPHRLHGQDGGDNVVGVVLPSRHAHQAVPGAADKDQAARAQEAQQPGPHKVRLARHKLPVLSLWPHLGVKYCS